ncbi:ATP-dependent zinc metalloprotease FtsH [Candidatus Nomurabacteria bacterium]|nr:ATP-dependent zinc metalloprotease FtsH [Candidatus Nomurabacteria bacterium]
MIALIVVAATFLLSDEEKKTEKQISLSEVALLVNSGEVDHLIVKGDKLELTLADEDATKKISMKESQASLVETLADYGVTPEVLSTLDLEIKDANASPGVWVLRILQALVPLLVLGVIIWFLFGQSKNGPMKAFNFGQTRARVTDPDKQRITFKDVAGNENAKQELLEIVDFLKNPKKYIEIGAKIPKGVLLTGQPGTGKTLLARAVAGEAKVPFFHLSGSEFVEMFVGVGASRVRDLFTQAKQMSPAIVFIDEIDAVGRHRGVGIGGGNDEREQTLNQILVEMDGFEPTEKVIVMAATNRADVLDSALLRPGRFDRRVMLDMPDRKERKAILEIHARRKPLTERVDLETIATRTPGFSGADLESLMNEGALLAARQDKKQIDMEDLYEAIEKVMIGPERKSHLHTPHERKIVAYHEAGHALVASCLEHADPVHKVSIVARGHAGGYTLKLPLEERKLTNRVQFLDDIAMSMGGYAAEKMIFGEVTTGPSNDIQVATNIARNMVTKWGMSDELGPIALEGNEGQAMFGQGVSGNQLSERHEALVDDEVSKIMNTAKERASQVLTTHREALDAIVEALLEKEILEQEDYNEIIKKHGITPKEHTED